MKQSEALSLAVEMLEKIGPSGVYELNEFHKRLRAIKTAASVAGPVSDAVPRTSTLCGEQFYEIERRTIDGRNLILMESSRDYGEAPGIIVDADTDEIVLEEANEGFLDLLNDQPSTGFGLGFTI